ncbi:low specificity L-threonine aldolase [Nemorincola caseinilytica]|uniref:Low specificity L-threonine aldolase n=1 Tax=Nemorincola caseinilytica TaxID=2054315 RepID=A0ABP8N6M4_9BACT
MKSFASDNYAGVLPQVMEALQQANTAHARSYGADDITARTVALFRDLFGGNAEVFFVFNGTGANVLSISSATHSYNSVLCADTSHIYCDESSAPETFTGCRFFPLAANEHGKLDAEIIAQRLIRRGDVHYAQAAMVSVTQATEYGTVYTQAELEPIAALCREHGLYLHMDGSRFFNAAAGLGCSLADISARAGVDILSLGGTKAGMMYGEAVVVFNKELARHIAYKHKQVMQLASKTRYIAAQFEAMLKDELWRSTAAHANAMAQRLHAALSAHPAVRVTRPVQANAVFAEIPRHWYEPLQEHYPFYVWKDSTHEVRLMCAWDTREEDIAAFAAAIGGLSPTLS